MPLRVDTSHVLGLALGASVAAHAAALFLASYGSAPPSVAENRPVTVEVQLEPERTPEAEPRFENRATSKTDSPKATRRPNERAAAARESAISSNVLTADEPESPPHFVIAISAGASDTRERASAPSAPTTSNDSDSASPFTEETVDVPASLSRGQIANYPRDARENGIEADVGLELVVSRDGSVESERVLRHVGYGLDEAALAAARSFRFSPAMKRGKPVRVRVRWTVEFRLQ